MPERVFYQGIVPLAVVRDTAFILLSTIQGTNNLFSRLMRIKYPDGSLLFDRLSLIYVCAQCRAKGDLEPGKVSHCPHMLPYLPGFHSRKQFKDLKLLNEGREQDFAAETLNLQIEKNNRVFDKQWTDMFAAAPPVHVNGQPTYVFIGYDPAPGTQQSEAAIHAEVVEEGMHIIVAQEAFFAPRPFTQATRIMAMIQKLMRVKEFRNSIFVVCAEANYRPYSEELIGIFEQNYPDLRNQVVFIREVKKTPGQVGITTVEHINQCWQLSQLLNGNRIRYWTKFNSIFTNTERTPDETKTEFVKQLEGYQRVLQTKFNEEKPWLPQKFVTTGKFSGRDDMIDAAELCQWGQIMFYRNKDQYGRFHRHGSQGHVLNN